MQLRQESGIIKCVIAGAAGTGKSQLLNRFAENKYSDEYEATIGVEFGAKVFDYGSDLIKLQFWDTAGHESFRSITSSYYQGSHIVLLCCDLTNRKSYDELSTLLKKNRSNAPENAIIGLVGTKTDKANRVISDEELETFKATHHLDFAVTCSAKDGSNVENVFLTALDCLNKKTPLQTSSISTESLRAEYKANGGGFIATIKIFGFLSRNSTQVAIGKMRERTAQRAGGASEYTLRTFGL